MKIFTKDNLLAAFVVILIVGGLVGAYAHVRASEQLIPLDAAASADVSAMPESKALKERDISLISVLCQQNTPADSFQLQVSYWVGKKTHTVQTATTCRSWGQELFMNASKTGWTIHSWPQANQQIYGDVIQTVYKDSVSKS